MKRLVTLCFVALLVGLPFAAWGQCPDPGGTLIRNDCGTWIDTDGDGMPGPNAATAVGQTVAFWIYVDSKTYAWTNFVTWFDNGSTGNTFFSISTTPLDPNAIVISEKNPAVTFFPFDNFTGPGDGFPAFGVGGTAVPTSGVQKICKITTKALHAAPSFTGCVSPRVDPNLAASTYTVFQSAGGNYSFACAGADSAGCYTISSGTAANQSSWGGIKSLYR